MEFVSDVLSQGTNRYRASFFELYAQEELRGLLSPVVRYVLSVLATYFPRYFIRIENAHDELFAITMYFVERHYLKQWKGTFAENFYGLRRSNIRPKGDTVIESGPDLVVDEELTPTQIQGSALIEVLIPYIQAKAKNYYDDLGGAIGDLDAVDDDAHFNSRIQNSKPWYVRCREKFPLYFRKLYPYMTLLYRTWLLLYNVKYIYTTTPYWRPWLKLLGLQVRRMSSKDFQDAQKLTSSMTLSPFRRDENGQSPSFGRIVLRSLLLAPSLGFEALKIALPTAIFFFRFLEWWYSSEGGYTRSRSKKGSDPDDLSLQPPKKPTVFDAHHRLIQPPKKNECPVHHGPIVNPTALPTGYVGCYRCLYHYVQEHDVCPITSQPIHLQELRRIRV